MKKDNIHDYAIAAFRYYNHCGRPKLGHRETADQEDLNAVYNTLMYLRDKGDDDTIRALELVYFSLPDGKIKRGQITSMVRNASGQMHRDASKIWERLAKAKRVFARERGLRYELQGYDWKTDQYENRSH